MMNRLKIIIKQEMPFLALIPALLWQLLFLGLPLGIMVFVSFSGGLTYYKMLLSDWVYGHIIIRSLLLAISTSFTCLLLAYPVAFFLAVYVQRFKGFFLFLLTIPFWTSFLVQIYAWFFLLERNGVINSLLLRLGIINDPLPLSNSFFSIFLVMVYCYLPFMIMPLYSILEKLDMRLYEASADLGAKPWQTFWYVIVPLTMPGIKTGVLLVMVPAFGELAIPTLMGGGKYMTVGSLIYHFFLVARQNYLGAAFTILSGVILLVIALGFRVLCNYLYRPTSGGRS
jgi:ABC-type spermidine/putrescine transport system permease subunit I